MGSDIGSIDSITQDNNRRFASILSGGIAWRQNNQPTVRSWNISGHIPSATLAEINFMQNLQFHGLPVIVDLSDRIAGLFTWGRVRSLQPVIPKISGAYHYTLILDEIPAIGTTYIQTDDAYLHDLAYHGSYKIFNPMFGRFGRTVSSDLLDWSWQFYVDNDDTGSSPIIIVEFHVGDDIDGFKLELWKSGGWVEIGYWGKTDSWDDIESIVDDNSQTILFRADKGAPAELLAGIGTISTMNGLYKRVLLEIDDLAAHSGTDLYNDYGNDQILLKATAEHTARDALRPYPVVTYWDGSIDYGRA